METNHRVLHLALKWEHHYQKKKNNKQIKKQTTPPNQKHAKKTNPKAQTNKQNHEKTRTGKDVEKLEPLCTAGERIKW